MDAWMLGEGEDHDPEEHRPAARQPASAENAD
jgi:hypothetical protein